MALYIHTQRLLYIGPYVYGSWLSTGETGSLGAWVEDP